MDGSGIRLVPGLDSKYAVTGWSLDGKSVYVVSTRASETVAKVYQVNTLTGKMDPWKTFGADAATGVIQVGGPHLSRDNTAYAYVYARVLSEAYVVTGLK